MLISIFKFLIKAQQFTLYVIILYMVAMTGLYFHMDSRIGVLQSIQTSSLDLFKSYSIKDMKQQGDIDDLSGQIEELTDQIEGLDDSIDTKLGNLTNLIVSSIKRTSEGGWQIRDLVVKAILDNSFNIVTLAWSSGLVWWLTSATFCLTLISKLYTVKLDLTSKGLKKPIGIFVSLFLLSIISFGLVVLYELSNIEESIYKIAIDSCGSFDVVSVSHIFAIVRKMYVISTSTIVIFLCVWLYIWFSDKPFIIDEP